MKQLTKKLEDVVKAVQVSVYSNISIIWTPLATESCSVCGSVLISRDLNVHMNIQWCPV